MGIPHMRPNLTILIGSLSEYHSCGKVASKQILNIAIGFFNLGDAPATVLLNFWDIGLPTASGRALEMFDCIEGIRLGVQKEEYAATVAAHGSRVYRCRVVKRND